jgi:hypothetical protein
MPKCGQYDAVDPTTLSGDPTPSQLAEVQGRKLWAMYGRGNTVSTEINTIEELETLPPGTVINDQGLRAVKTESGVWQYSDGQYWEPELPAETWD